MLHLSARKSGVSNRHGRSFWSAQSFDVGVELRRKRLNNAGTKPRLGLGKNAVWLSNPIIGNRKFPIYPGHFVGDGDLSIFCVCIESVL